MFFEALGAVILGSGATAAAATAVGALVTNLAITAASMAYQMSQANKQKKLAAEAAEARKGFETVSEGISTPLPIVYGRAKIGGQRVWINTSTNLKLGATNADTVISTFNELVAQSSSEQFPFVHPGVDNFRVTYPESLQTELSGAVTKNDTIAFYADVTIWIDPGEGGTTITERRGIPPSWTATVVSSDATGFNATIKNPDSASLTGETIFYKIPYTKVVTELTGDKNEFLVMQQALCQAPIHQVYDMMMDDQRFIDDADMSDSPQSTVLNSGIKKGIRAECYLNGGVPHANTVRNFSDRKDAKFTKVASVSVFAKLDRNNPQFNEIPITTFFIEGRTVKQVTKSGSIYSLSGSRTYSNNPSWCLLDYLMDETCGKALRPEEIDLESFYNSAAVCDTIVQTGVLTGGKIWQPTNKSRNVTSRDLPLYECNIIVDVTKPVRANVESILSTMGDARLVWSGGKYKLKVQYPRSNP